MGTLVSSRILKILAAVVLLVLLFAIGYSYAIEPWIMTIGATYDEVNMTLPGDSYVPNPKAMQTQAITIDAPPQKVWPWLVQMGQDRAGFYSYERLERLLGFGIHNTYRIVPEWQRLEAGDFVKFHQYGIGMQVVSVVKERNILMVTDPRRPMKPEKGKMELILPYPRDLNLTWNWDFNLFPQKEGKTRLVVRGYATWGDVNPALNWLLHFAIGVPTSVMGMRMQKEIKQCAEGTYPGLGKKAGVEKGL